MLFRNKKFILSLSIMMLLLLFLYFITGSEKTRKNIKKYLPEEITIIKNIFFDRSSMGPRNFLAYDNMRKYLYNAEFLPDSHFSKLKLEEMIIDTEIGNSNTSYFIESYENTLTLANRFGDIYHIDISKILLDKKKIQPSKYKTNIKLNENSLVLDVLVSKEKIYLSIKEQLESCSYLKILYADKNSETLVFENFFKSEECFGNQIYRSGKMELFNFNNNEGILITTVDNIQEEPLNSTSQNENSIYGKTLFINIESKKELIFSSGHRNAQGLYVAGEVILSSEHGPKGGDEINKIEYGHNYGWPIVSLGKPYNEKSLDPFLKSHEDNNFTPPIFSFIPSIGMSDIEKISDDFYSKNELKNLFIIASLNARSIFLTQFDKEFKKINFYEKIMIGERIRDLEFIENLNILIMSYDQESKLGILKPN